LIRNNENQPRSFYERMSVSQGGVKGSRDKKTQIIDTLLEKGAIEIVELDTPKGRQTHYIRIAEPKPTDDENKYNL